MNNMDINSTSNKIYFIESHNNKFHIEHPQWHISISKL